MTPLLVRQLSAIAASVTPVGTVEWEIRFYGTDALVRATAWVSAQEKLAALSSPEAPQEQKMTDIKKREAGLYRKFDVRRRDGSDAPGGKHEDCNCFVLDLTHDPHAIPALRAYAASCRQDYPNLAADLDELVEAP